MLVVYASRMLFLLRTFKTYALSFIVEIGSNKKNQKNFEELFQIK